MPHRTLERLRAEFLEMPGLRLTAEQVHRFCGVERADCVSALDELVRENFLSEKPDGTYARATEGHQSQSRKRTARAVLPPHKPTRQAS
jgi:hypothetical protein